MASEAASRARRAVGRVCAAVGVAALTASLGARVAAADAEPAADRVEPASDAWGQDKAPVRLVSGTKQRPPVLVYPPSGASETETRPLVVMLHGMCDSPENECPQFLTQATGDRWLACPRADLACEGGGTIWNGATRKRTKLIADAVERLRASFPGRVESGTGQTLIGFSLGSFVALDVAQHAHGEWKNLVLVGAKVFPDAKKLRAAGVENVLLASGDRDMMKWHMVGQAAKLRRRGIHATFMSMGNVGHWFSKDMEAWTGRALAWLESPASGDAAPSPVAKLP